MRWGWVALAAIGIGGTAADGWVVTKMLEFHPDSGRAPLAVRFEIRGVRWSINERIKLEFGDGTTADSFVGTKLSGTLIETGCRPADNGGRICDYRVEHLYREAGTFPVALVQVGLCGSDPPSCGETRLLARATVKVGE